MPHFKTSHIVNKIRDQDRSEKLRPGHDLNYHTCMERQINRNSYI